jgi:hypothetical protein
LAVKTFPVNERRACGLLHVRLSSCRYLRKPDRNEELRQQPVELERLTAQLNAPLTREEQLKKLKRTKEDPAAGPQSDFFEAPPEKPQGATFLQTE